MVISELVSVENQMQDILHYIEMAPVMKAKDGNRIYRELQEVRKRRRALKSEIELLAPGNEMFPGTKILDQLANVKGNCNTVRQTIQERCYMTRTDILDSFCEKR